MSTRLRGNPGVAVVDFNVLANHLHLSVEGEGAVALARGMQGLAIRIARRVNRPA